MKRILTLGGCLVWSALAAVLLPAQADLAVFDSIYHQYPVRVQVQQRVLRQLSARSANASDPTTAAFTKYVMADQFFSTGDWVETEANIAQALAFLPTSGTDGALTQRLQLRLHLLQGRLHQAKGNINQAVFHYRQIHEKAKQAAPVLVLDAIAAHAGLCLRTGEYATALDLLQRGEQQQQTVAPSDSTRFELSFQRLEGELQAEVGMDSLAATTLSRLLPQALQHQDTAQWITTQLLLGRIQHRQGNRSASKTTLGTAYQTAQAFGEPALVAQSLLGLAQLHDTPSEAAQRDAYLDDAIRQGQMFGLDETLARAYTQKGTHATGKAAIALCRKGYDLAEEKRWNDIRMQACACLQYNYTQLKDWQQALYFADEHNRLQLQLNDEAVVRKVNAAAFARSMTAMQQASNAQLSLLETEQAQAKSQLAWHQHRNKILAVLLALALVTVGIIVWQLFENREQSRALQRLNDELHHTNAQLAAANNQLADNNAALSQFAAVAAHDLKGPLRSIHSFTQLLRRRLGDKVGDNEAEYFGYIHDSTQKLTVLIDDLLNFSRLGKAMEAPAPVDLNAVMAQVQSNLYQDIQDKGATLHLSDLPTVSGHASLLTQLFQNLVSNSLKFTNAGVAPLVSVRQMPDMAKRAHIVVEDNGIGIAADDQARVFELFTRLHTDQAYRGSGVGLASCRKIVQHYDGQIWITSTEGKGTQVHIVL